MPLPAQVVLSRSLKASMAAASKASLALLQKKLDAVKYRVANQFWAQSLDHALHMGLGVDLSYFHRKNRALPSGYRVRDISCRQRAVLPRRCQVRQWMGCAAEAVSRTQVQAYGGGRCRAL